MRVVPGRADVDPRQAAGLGADACRLLGAEREEVDRLTTFNAAVVTEPAREQNLFHEFVQLAEVRGPLPARLGRESPP